MHHSKFRIGREKQPVVVNHNSDWSGDVQIVFNNDLGEHKEVWIPGLLLLELGKAAATEDLKNKMVAFIEDL